MTLAATLADLRAVLDAREGEGVVLAGYSMGGRIALHLALAEQDRLSGVVLVSSTSGIEDPAERERRVQAAVDTVS